MMITLQRVDDVLFLQDQFTPFDNCSNGITAKGIKDGTHTFLWQWHKTSAQSESSAGFGDFGGWGEAPHGSLVTAGCLIQTRAKAWMTPLLFSAFIQIFAGFALELCGSYG